jgi:AP-1 complex subunit beta-1
LTTATEQVSNPDIKDRAYIYWRMLSTSPQKCQDVVLGKKPAIASDTYNIYDEDLVEKLISGIGGLSSLYHKTPGEWSKEQAKYNQPKKEDAKPVEEEKKEKKAKPVKEKKKAQPESSSDEEEK